MELCGKRYEYDVREWIMNSYSASRLGPGMVRRQLGKPRLSMIDKVQRPTRCRDSATCSVSVETNEQVCAARMMCDAGVKISERVTLIDDHASRMFSLIKIKRTMRKYGCVITIDQKTRDICCCNGENRQNPLRDVPQIESFLIVIKLFQQNSFAESASR